MGASEATQRVERLIEDNLPGLLAYFLGRARDPEDAADLLGDTLLVLWRKARVVPVDDVEARMWVYGVARRVTSTQRRSRRRRSALAEQLRSQLHAEAQAAEPLGHDLGAALQELDPLDREIIRLVHWDGFTQVEAARHLQLPEGTVRSRHHRARRRLRALLESPADQPSPLRRHEPSGRVR